MRSRDRMTEKEILAANEEEATRKALEQAAMEFPGHEWEQISVVTPEKEKFLRNLRHREKT